MIFPFTSSGSYVMIPKFIPSKAFAVSFFLLTLPCRHLDDRMAVATCPCKAENDGMETYLTNLKFVKYFYLFHVKQQ